MLSKVLFNFSSGIAFFNSGICLVRHKSGPMAQSIESNNTDKLPVTGIFPLCTANLDPMTDRDSPKSFLKEYSIYFLIRWGFFKMNLMFSQFF